VPGRVHLGASAQQRENLIDMLRDPDNSHWLSVGMPEQQRQLSELIRIEQTADELVGVSPLLIPGLFQTADYARAVMVEAELPAAEIPMRVTCSRTLPST
jgi:hypothetical protein